MAIHRKKRPLVRTIEQRDARLLIVATEGEKTEKIYFDSFRNSRVKIVTVPSKDGKSAPSHVLDNIEEFRRDHELDADDELWIVVDRDRWAEKSLSIVASSCVSKGVNLAVSNPCFELWLALHCDENLPSVPTGEALEGHIRKHLGAYQKNNYDASRLITNLGLAMERARQLDTAKDHRWPLSTGTRVYKVFESFVLPPKLT